MAWAVLILGIALTIIGAVPTAGVVVNFGWGAVVDAPLFAGMVVAGVILVVTSAAALGGS